MNTLPKCLTLGLAAFAALPLTGCTFQTRPGLTVTDHRTPDRDGYSIAATTAEGEIKGRHVLGNPIPLPETRTLLIPYVVESDKGMFDDDDPFANRGGTETYATLHANTRVARDRNRANAFRVNARWHNAFFRDMDTGEDWMLLDERGVISLAQSVPDDPSTDTNEGLVAFVATIDDTNQDGRMDNRDARVVILTDADGRDPRIISPRDAQVLAFRYQADSKTLWLDILRDSNGDLAFKADDDRLPYLCRPLDDRAASPVIALDTIDRARTLLSEGEEISAAE